MFMSFKYNYTDHINKGMCTAFIISSECQAVFNRRLQENVIIQSVTKQKCHEILVTSSQI